VVKCNLLILIFLAFDNNFYVTVQKRFYKHSEYRHPGTSALKPAKCPLLFWDGEGKAV